MDSLHNLTIFDIYEKNALHKGNLDAIVCNELSISYASLFSATSKLAAGLKRLNLPTGSRIAVLCKNHPVFFELFGAASALNHCLVLINRRLSNDEVNHIIEDTTPAVIICDKEMATQAKQLTDQYSYLDHCFVVDDGNEQFENLYNNTEIDCAIPCKPTDPYIIIHTAAVQGKPRGAILSQENVILSNQQIIHAYGLDDTKTYLNILPVFHIMGINLGLGTLQAGGTNIILEKFNPTTTLKLIQDQKVNLFGSFPPILTTIADAMEESNFDLSSLEIVAGLEMPAMVKKWESLTTSKFWTMYGQTETSGLISFSEYFTKPGSAGVISPLANIKIVDEFDTFLAPGETGEIVVRGSLVFQGYWNAEDLNAQTFREGWHHTGDLGKIDSDGFLFFKGRKAEKELIKPGGENVFPAEVEKAILTNDAIKDVCVFGVPDPKFGEGIKAICTLNEGMSLTKDELIQFCGSLIAGYKKPRYVEFTGTLPKTEDGTIDREMVKAKFS